MRLSFDSFYFQTLLQARVPLDLAHRKCQNIRMLRLLVYLDFNLFWQNLVISRNIHLDLHLSCVPQYFINESIRPCQSLFLSPYEIADANDNHLQGIIYLIGQTITLIRLLPLNKMKTSLLPSQYRLRMRILELLTHNPHSAYIVTH